MWTSRISHTMAETSWFLSELRMHLMLHHIPTGITQRQMDTGRFWEIVTAITHRQSLHRIPDRISNWSGLILQYILSPPIM